MNNSSKLRDAIFTVLYYCNGFLGGKGTGFVISHNSKLYFVSADHCIDNNIHDLFITNLLYDEPRKIPFSKCIKEEINKQEEDSLYFFEIDMDRILEEIKEYDNLNPINLANNLLRNKKIQKILNKNWNVKTKWKHIQNSLPYKRQNENIYPSVKSLSLSDVQTKSLKYVKQYIFKKEEKFYVLGYPAERQEIDNEKKHVKSTLMGIDCEYIEKLPHSSLHHLAVIENKIMNYDGFSGSPVIYNGDVCGVVIRAGNGNIHFKDLANIDIFLDD